jgi:AraC-like DNA-binding protein
MTAPSDDVSLRFSTDELPERDRLPMMREVIGRLVARADLEPAADKPLRFRFAVRALPGLTVSSYQATSMTWTRTRELLTDGNDDIVLAVSPTAGHLASQAGREVVVGAGDAIPFSSAELAMIRTVSTPHCHLISLQRSMLETRVPDLEDRFLRPIPGGNEALRLLIRYVRLFEDLPKTSTAELRRVIVDHVYDLAALAIGASQDTAEAAKTGGVRAARLHAIKADIAASAGQQGLTLTDVAARHGVSPRYVQVLFEREGLTFSQFLLAGRLARAHRMLSDPQSAGYAVSAIAYGLRRPLPLQPLVPPPLWRKPIGRANVGAAAESIGAESKAQGRQTNGRDVPGHL